MPNLKEKIKKSKEIILEASKKWKPKEIAIAWTGGKDSTALLHLVRTVFKGKIPFPVMFNDSTMEFQEIYGFIDKWAKEWKLNLVRVKHLPEDLKLFKATKDPRKKKELSRIMKINAINYALDKYKWKAFMVGIRWDEHESRSKEKYFSERTGHTRIHPILHFTEDDVWKYIRLYNVPYVSLYDDGYRSLGERPFTGKAKKGDGERSGRERDKEKIMRRLRSLGYW